MASGTRNARGAGRRKEPTALTEARGSKHLTSSEKELARKSEVYVAYGRIAPPEWLEGEARKVFQREARYMRRLNHAAGCAVYGDQDVELLAAMSLAYARAREYAERERRARDAEAKAKWNNMRNKELACYEKFLRTLKLDPSSRVIVPGRDGGEDDGDDIIDIM